MKKVGWVQWLILAVGLWAGEGAATAQDSAVTWSHQIAPLVYNNCTTCHHPGGAGPFSLLTYEDAKRWGAQMAAVTSSRYMPPWLPEHGYGDFADERRLTSDEIALIAKWVQTGMPARRCVAPPRPRPNTARPGSTANPI